MFNDIFDEIKSRRKKLLYKDQADYPDPKPIKKIFIFKKKYFIPVIILFSIMVFICIWFGHRKTDKVSREREFNSTDTLITSSRYIVENFGTNIVSNLEKNSEENIRDYISQSTEENNELNSIKISEKSREKDKMENTITKKTEENIIMDNIEENIIMENTEENIIMENTEENIIMKKRRKRNKKYCK